MMRSNGRTGLPFAWREELGVARLAGCVLTSALALLASLLVGIPAGVAAAPAARSNSAQSAGTAGVVVENLTVNHLDLPLGVPVEAPVLSWQLQGSGRGVVQSAYQIQVARAGQGFSGPLTWDSGRVAGSQSVNVRYAGPPLDPRTRYEWRVQVWDGAGTLSSWSQPAWFETALPPEATNAAAWDAGWIGAPVEQPQGLDWSGYTLTVRTSNVTDALGIVFYADSAAARNTYMWQLSTRGGPSLRPHSRVDGAWTELDVVPLDAPTLPGGFAAEHEVTIDLAGGQAVTSIDGTEVDSRPLPLRSAGTIGFRTAAGESGDVHKVTVTEGTTNGTGEPGRVLFETDFSDGTNPFAIGEVRDGVLKVSGVVENGVMKTEEKPLPLLRRDFQLPAQVSSARLYATAAGVYQARINGERVGDHELAPGWTDYSQLVQYQTYDVTDLLRAGENTIGAELSPGWYAGNIAWHGPKHFGTNPAFLARLEVTLEDGSTHTVTTDENWVMTSGPVVDADLLMGETYDFGSEVPGWSEPRAGGDWSPVMVLNPHVGDLAPQTDPPVRVTERLSVVKRTTPEPGVAIYDLGQNMVGWTDVLLRGQAGDRVRIRHGEVLNPDGTLYTANLRTAAATETVTLGEDGTVRFSPRFTFHGFRYVEISGLDSLPAVEDVAGVVIGTDNRAVSSFDTSDPMLNQLQSNITWGIRGNFLSAPTDTPARDERLGYSGDLNVIADTAVFNQDAYAFLDKWLRDMRLRQAPNGVMPQFAPGIDPGVGESVATAGWGDGFITVTHALWRNYGDRQVIDRNWSAMVRLVDHWTSVAHDHIVPDGHAIGDWLNLNDPTPDTLLATAYYAQDARLLSEMAAASGRDADAAKYQKLAGQIRSAFAARFIREDGTIGTGSQTGYAMAIDMGLVPPARLETVGRRFVAAIQANGWHLSTGFLGTPHLLPALTAIGRDDVAYRLLLEKQYPSWLYEVTMGATTTWERWDSIRPDGTFQDPSMNSFNHYAYGAVGEWMYSTMGGITPTTAGYATFRVEPRPGGDLTYAAVGHDSPYGRIASRWETLPRHRLQLDVTVPANTTATVVVPAVSRHAVTEDGRPAVDAPGVRFVRSRPGATIYEVGSGSYSFISDDIRGHLGMAREHSKHLNEIATRIAREVADTVVAKRMPVETHQLTEALDQAWTAYLGGDQTAAADALATGQARAARIAQLLQDWRKAGKLTVPQADDLTALLRRVERAMSDAARLMHAVTATMAVAGGPIVPGSSFPIEGTLVNNGDRPVRDITLTLDVPGGWSAEPVTVPGTVEPGESATLTTEVRVAATQPVAEGVELPGTLAYHRGPSTVHVPVSTLIDVESPVRIVSMTAEPELLERPGDASTITVTLENRRRDQPLAGRLDFTAPSGWKVTPGSVDYQLAADQTASFDTTATSPSDTAVLAGNIAVAASYQGGPAPGDRAQVRVTSAIMSWTFETDGDAEGWAPWNQLTDFRVVDGSLRATSTGGDPHMVFSPASLPLPAGGYLQITMTSSTASEGQIFWATERGPGLTENRSTKFGVNVGGPHVYLVPIPAQDTRLTMLRIDPLNNAGELSIDSVRLVN